MDEQYAAARVSYEAGALEEADLARTPLAQFEAWYREAHGTPFWILFEHYMPETPLVDF